MIFALADQTIEIRPEHLKAALAVWQYCEDSARYLFADAVIDSQVLKLYKALKTAGSQGLSQTQITVDVFQKNTSASKLSSGWRRCSSWDTSHPNGDCLKEPA